MKRTQKRRSSDFPVVHLQPLGHLSVHASLDRNGTAGTHFVCKPLIDKWPATICWHRQIHRRNYHNVAKFSRNTLFGPSELTFSVGPFLTTACQSILHFGDNSNFRKYLLSTPWRLIIFIGNRCSPDPGLPDVRAAYSSLFPTYIEVLEFI